jgi:hypothetical protein
VSDNSAVCNGQSQTETGAISSFAMNEWLEKRLQYLARRTGTMVQDLYLVEITCILQNDLYATAR